MTTPEKKPVEVLVSRRHGAESLYLYDAAQRAIEDTRKLLDELAHYQILPRGKSS